MGDTNRVQLAYSAAESTFGSVVSGSALKLMRITGESLVQTNNMVTSNEIRADRQVTDVIRVGMSTSGDVNAELSYAAHDDLFQYALCSSGWSSPVTVTAATISMASGDNSINSSAAGFGSMVANQWIKVSGFANAANNGVFKIVSQTASKLVLSGVTVVTEAAGPTVTVKLGAQIVNGTTLTTVNLERAYTDLTNQLSLFTGQAVDKFGLNVQSNQLLTASFGFMGKKETSITATNGSAYTAAPTNDVQSATDNITAILEGQAQYDSTQLSFNLMNNLRSRLQIALLGPKSLGMGEVGLTGNLVAYLNSAAVMDKYLNVTKSSLATVTQDAAGNTYLLDCPRVKFTNGKRVAGAKNTDVMADMTFTAYRHETEGVTLRIARF